LIDLGSDNIPGGSKSQPSCPGTGGDAGMNHDGGICNLAVAIAVPASFAAVSYGQDGRHNQGQQDKKNNEVCFFHPMNFPGVAAPEV